MQLKVGDWISHDFGTFQELVNKTMNVEAMAVERETGVPFEVLASSLPSGSRTAVTAFVWILQKREQPTLKFHQVVFEESELELIFTDADEARAKVAQEQAEDPQSAGESEPAE